LLICSADFFDQDFAPEIRSKKEAHPSLDELGGRGSLIDEVAWVIDRGEKLVG
jgi:hypothetical protein